MPRNLIIALLLCTLLLCTSADKPKRKSSKIQIALLLDVSGSMAGLINQAKGQFWRMVNELTKATRNGQNVRIELSILSYGGDTLAQNDYIQLHTLLTTDVDLVSTELFKLRDGGLSEYCGQAIQMAVDSLNWSPGKKDLKVIFIAGNEMFDQGNVDYRQACKEARKRRIIVNTVYCGSEQLGVDELWASGAKIARGKYLQINIDTTYQLANTLWDDKIIEFNSRLNSTYIPFGDMGDKALRRQKRSDENAMLLGNAYMRERVMFKISEYYNNPHWDLVYTFNRDTSILSRLKKSELPLNMSAMTHKRRTRYLQEKQMEREVYQQGVRVYCEKAREFLISAGKEDGFTPSLDNSIINTIKEQGTALGYKFE